MGGSGKVLIVEVNPAHVVSIPNDYNNAKGRAEGYLITGEVPEDQAEFAFADVSFATYDDSDYITYEQEGDIDYSGIDEGYEDSWNDYDEEEASFDYDSGHAEGNADANTFLIRNASHAALRLIEDTGTEITYLDEWFDGYNDGYFEVTHGRELQAVADENEDLNQTAYDLGAEHFYGGVGKSPFKTLIALSIPAEEADEFVANYVEGYDNATEFSKPDSTNSLSRYGKIDNGDYVLTNESAPNWWTI
jgi:hypothetical protein